MGMVTGIIIYVGPKLVRPLRAQQDLMLQDDGSLCQKFRQLLLKGPEAFNVQLGLAPHSVLSCSFSVFGQTAGVANWWRGRTTDAMTAYLSGIDEAAAGLVEQALASKPSPIPLYRWHEVLKAKQPIFATFLLTPASANDRLIATAAPALANSFFSTLGVT